MRKTLFLLLISFNIFSFAQLKVTAAPDKLILTEDVFKVDSLSAAEIYSNSIKWVNRSFKNPEYVLKASVPGDMIRLSAIWQIPSKGVFGKTTLNLSYTMQIDIKAGKVRLSFYDLKGLNKFYYSMCFKANGEKRNSGEVQNYFSDIENYTTVFIEQYLEYAKGKNDNW